MDVHVMTMLLGFAGGVVVLASFAATASGRLSAHGARYHVLNIAGAVAMIASGLAAGAWPSVTVNVAWALISARQLVKFAPPVRLRSRVRGVATMEHERVAVRV